MIVTIAVLFVLFYHFSNNSSHFVSHKTIQKVCLMFAGGMLGTCLLNHFRDSTRMEQWYSHDFTVVSASFLILRILILFLFLNYHRSPFHASQLQRVLFACASCIYTITRPYKLNFMNNVDVVQ